jgi:hypothetical protein
VSAALVISIAMLLATIAGSLALLVRSGETRVTLLTAMATLMAAHQGVALWSQWGAPLALDVATGGELAALAASGLMLLVVIGAWRTLDERDRAEAIHWDSMEAVRALNELSAKPALDLEEQFTALLELGCRRFGAEIGIVSRVSGERYEVRAIRAPKEFPVTPGAVFALADTDCGSALSAQRPVAFESAADSSRTVHANRTALPFEAYLGAAIRVGEQPVGTICFGSLKPRSHRFTATDKDLLLLMATWLGAEIERRGATPEGPARRVQPVASPPTVSEPAPRAPEVPARRTEDLNATLRRLDRKLRRCVGPEIELVVALRPDLRAADARRVPLEAIVLSLVENAARAMPDGGRIIVETDNVEIAGAEPGVMPAVAPNRYVTLSVSDTGSGTDRDTLSQIFAPSEPSDDPLSASDPGNRLSLPAVYRVLQRCGGDLSVDVEPGHGSTFTVFLPELESAEERAPAHHDPARAHHATPG